MGALIRYFFLELVREPEWEDPDDDLRRLQDTNGESMQGNESKWILAPALSSLYPTIAGRPVYLLGAYRSTARSLQHFKLMDVNLILKLAV